MVHSTHQGEVGTGVGMDTAAGRNNRDRAPCIEADSQQKEDTSDSEVGDEEDTLKSRRPQNEVAVALGTSHWGHIASDEVVDRRKEDEVQGSGTCCTRFDQTRDRSHRPEDEEK